MNGGRNYNGPKVNELASLSKIWLYAGKSENPTLRDLISRVKMRWVQTISRKGQWRKVSTEILRDCMPDSNESWKRYSPNCMATCRGWQKCPPHFPNIDESKERTSAAKAALEGQSNGTSKLVPFPKQLMCEEA